MRSLCFSVHASKRCSRHAMMDLSASSASFAAVILVDHARKRCDIRDAMVVGQHCERVNEDRTPCNTPAPDCLRRSCARTHTLLVASISEHACQLPQSRDTIAIRCWSCQRTSSCTHVPTIHTSRLTSSAELLSDGRRDTSSVPASAGWPWSANDATHRHTGPGGGGVRTSWSGVRALLGGDPMHGRVQSAAW